jgi:hypothetical protein
MSYFDHDENYFVFGRGNPFNRKPSNPKRKSRMTNKSVEFVIRGEIDWCKLLGDARPYTGDPRYNKGPFWSVEINPDAKSREKLASYGLGEKFKTDKKTKKDGSPTKNPREYDFIRLTVLE